MQAAELSDLKDLAASLALDVLIEVHDAGELETALALHPKMIGVNNRNLKTFETSLNNTLDLLPQIPGDVLTITESGINSIEDVSSMRRHGVHAFLVGEAFMRADDPGAALRALFG